MATTASISWQTIKNFIWLLLGITCLFVALIFMVGQSKKEEVEIIEIEQQAQDAARPVQSEKVGMDVNLGGFKDEVPPLVVKQRVVDDVEHEAEFRGSKFLSENQKFWTLQVMQVNEEDIIRLYLSKRQDRKDFQYFRLQTENQPEKFVLTYGVYKDAQDVLNKTQAIGFDLPETLAVKPEKFSSYEKLINDLGSDELSTGTKLRSIVLTKAALPVIPVVKPNVVPSTPSTRKSEEDSISREIKRLESSNTTTSISRTESQPKPNNSSSVPQDIKPPIKPTVHEAQIVDPFN